MDLDQEHADGTFASDAPGAPGVFPRRRGALCRAAVAAVRRFRGKLAALVGLPRLMRKRRAVQRARRVDRRKPRSVTWNAVGLP